MESLHPWVALKTRDVVFALQHARRARDRFGEEIRAAGEARARGIVEALRDGLARLQEQLAGLSLAVVRPGTARGG